MNVKINDIVRFLNDVGGGRVARIDGKTIYVEDEDGFERPVLERELVVVGQAGTKASAYERPLDIRARQVEPDKPAPQAQPVPEPVLPVEETPEGEVLNVVLGYEAREIKHLNTTTFYASLVNDSNYYLYFTYMTRGDETSEWTTRYHGIVEPNIQVQLEEFGHDDLNDMTHIAVQYVAFKQGKGFRLKNPALIEQRLDVTKFYKVHCFHDNPYYDVPVIAIEIVTNDRPARQMHIDSSELERAMKEKKRLDRPQRKPVKKNEKHDQNGIIVQDLHIASLMDNLTGMTPSAILEYQMDKFREVMDANINKHGQRIVFIHGKGEGKLRQHLLGELRRRYPRCTAQDASFREYGFGATQVTIH